MEPDYDDEGTEEASKDGNNLSYFSLILHSLVLSPIPDEEPCHPDDEVVYEDVLPATTNIGSNGTARPYRRLSLDRSQTVIKPIPRGSSFFVLSHTNRSEPEFDVSKLIFSFSLFPFGPFCFSCVLKHCK